VSVRSTTMRTLVIGVLVGASLLCASRADESQIPRIGALVLPLGTSAQQAAQVLGLQLVILDARNVDELDAALRSIRRNVADGILIAADPLLDANRSKIAQIIHKARLPAISPFRQYHDEGVLMSYGADLREAGRKMAAYVVRIIKGAKPSDLPIEQMSKYELVIDLRVANELGIKVPWELLMRADEVIR
jgi:ABC-type uncharacterized transport system substrate-binding protein